MNSLKKLIDWILPFDFRFSSGLFQNFFSKVRHSKTTTEIIYGLRSEDNTSFIDLLSQTDFWNDNPYACTRNENIA